MFNKEQIIKELYYVNGDVNLYQKYYNIVSSCLDFHIKNFYKLEGNFRFDFYIDPVFENRNYYVLGIHYFTKDPITLRYVPISIKELINFMNNLRTLKINKLCLTKGKY